MKTYHRHLTGQWLNNFLLAFLILNLLLLVGNLVKYGTKVGVANILPMLPALLPSMLIYSLPMAALTSTISTLSRARQLCEPITLASSGIGLFKLLPPFILIGLALNTLTVISFQWLQPMGEAYKHRYLGNIGAKILQSELEKPLATLLLGSDTLSFFDRGEGMRSAVIQHRENGRIVQEVFAQNARVDINKEAKQISLITEGKVHVLNYQQDQQVDNLLGQLTLLDFPPIPLSYPERFSSSGSYRQWPLTKMWRAMQLRSVDNPLKLSALFYEKISLSLSPLLLIIAAFPLGFLGKDSNRVTGFLIGLGLIFIVYYPLLLLGKKLVLDGMPLAFLWPQLPNITLLLIGVWGLKQLDHRI
jgi:lipopolysaccharide export system permease protein